MKNKNLHLIPTDKPSRLHLIENALTITSEYKNSVCDSEVNIYITNDEVPKDGEWCIFGESGLTQYCSDYSKKMYRKIILTDNQDLIKDGVQKIDDEFLEWFIKNPSCEEVEIEKICNNCGDINCIHAICSSQISKNKGVTYKIIIPKEPKQDYSGVHLRHCYQGEYEDGCKYGEDDCPAKPLEEPKQETLEETYNKWSLEEAQKFALSKFKYGNHSEKG